MKPSNILELLPSHMEKLTKRTVKSSSGKNEDDE